MVAITFEEVATGLHAGLCRSKIFGEHVQGILFQKAGREAFAIQLKRSTPQELITKMAAGLRASLELNKHAVSRSIGDGKFSKGTLVTASPPERRIIISKIG